MLAPCARRVGLLAGCPVQLVGQGMGPAPDPGRRCLCPLSNKMLANVAGHSLSRMWALQLPGVGHDRSRTVAMAFGSALELAQADANRWQMVNGIGKVLAHKIVDAIRERGK